MNNVKIKQRKKYIYSRIKTILDNVSHLNRELAELHVELSKLDVSMDTDDDERERGKKLILDDTSWFSEDDEYDCESNNRSHVEDIDSIDSDNYNSEDYTTKNFQENYTQEEYDPEPDFELGERVMILSNHNNLRGECGTITSFLGRRVNIKLEKIKIIVQRDRSSIVTIP